MRALVVASVASCFLFGVTPPSEAVVINVDFAIDGTQEFPVVATSALGSGSVQYNTVTNQLDWNVAFSGIESGVTLAHFHGPAAVGANAAPQVNIGTISGLVSPMIGSTVITDTQEQQLLNELWYVNIHSVAHGGGEIRGQVRDIPAIHYEIPLTGDEESPPVPTLATGLAKVDYDPVANLLSWDVNYSGIVGGATLAHFHGPALPGDTAGPQVDIGTISGLVSPMIGSTTITDAQESELLSGLWYVNVHSQAHGSGEIRGQVVPEPATITMVGAVAAVWAVGVLRRRRTRGGESR